MAIITLSLDICVYIGGAGISGYLFTIGVKNCCTDGDEITIYIIFDF